MGFFGRGKKNDIVDLSERYRKQKEREQNMKEDIAVVEKTSTSETAASPFSFFDSSASTNAEPTSSGSEDFVDLSGPIGDKRKRLAKRILDMTTKIEDLSNQIYHLQQRIEVLERKLDINNY